MTTEEEALQANGSGSESPGNGTVVAELENHNNADNGHHDADKEKNAEGKNHVIEDEEGNTKEMNDYQQEEGETELKEVVVSIDGNIQAIDTALGTPEKGKTKTFPVQLEWKDIQYTVKVKQGLFKSATKQILHPMSGHVSPGHVIAIMGPSGAGKTSLLNILAQRVGNYKGEILVNGNKIKKNFRSYSAFVQQDDVLMGNLTPYEILWYTALLRLSSGISLAEKKKRVLEVIDELGLSRCMNTKVGVPGISKGLSGGERKRLSIGVELITSPSILFLDEPTTGLDAKTALNLIELLNILAKKGRTIVLTIHQPRSDIFQLFDKLLMLARGKVAYFGKAADATKYFASIGYECPSQYNPADYIIDLVAESSVDREKDEERIKHITDTYHQDREKHEAVPTPPNFNMKGTSSYNSLWIVQLIVIFVRSFKNILRDRILTFSRLFQTVCMSLLVGLFFLRTSYFQKNIQDRVGVLFFMLVSQAMGAVFSSATVAPSELAVFNRERSSKSYHVSSYYLGRSLAELPNVIFFPILFGCISYFMVGLHPTAERFFIFLGIMIMLSITAQSLGQCIATISPKPDVALAITPVLTTVLMLFGGFYLNIQNIAPWFIWIYWISFFHYGYESLVLNEFDGLTFTCSEDEFVQVGDQRICPVTSGNQVIRNLSMDGVMSQVWINILFLLALTVILKTITFLALRFLKKPKV